MTENLIFFTINPSLSVFLLHYGRLPRLRIEDVHNNHGQNSRSSTTHNSTLSNRNPFSKNRTT